MNIVVIGYGDSSTPSTRFRFSQYQSLFEQRGHCLSFLFKSQIKSAAFWGSLQSADVIINQKCLLKNYYIKKILALNKPIFFDFDDAIWTRPGRGFGPVTRYRVHQRFKNVLKSSTGVLVANPFLADRASQYCNHVHVVPMALDTSCWKPSSCAKDSEQLVLGWNGSPHNLPLLESLADTLRQILLHDKRICLKVFCGKKPAFVFPFEYQAFCAANEIAFVQSLHVGLLPLLADEYSEGKSPIKALQYLACGVPVVGHVNQGGASFLTKETCFAVDSLNDWQTSLKKALNNGIERKNLGNNGVDLVARKHSLTIVFELLCTAISC